MDKTLRKDIIKAWERYLNDTCTRDDLALVLDSIKDDAYIEEIKEVFSVEWNSYELPPTPEDRKEAYRKKAAQLLAEHENRRRMQQRPTIVRFRKIWYAAAAILLGLLIPTVAYLYMKPETKQISVQYAEAITQRGEIKTVVLPDLSEVTLNAGSYLKYPENFTGAERSVELYGEAIFNVTSDPARPFTVKTENMNIKVVGTVFDVKEYADDLTASVSVASGKVEVDLLETGRAASLVLEQNQQFKIDKTTGLFEKTIFDADTYLSWTDGTLCFYRTPIREVVNILNRKYPQVDIDFAEGEYSHVISGKHKNIYPLEDILKAIAYSTGLKCRKKGVNKYVLFHEE